MVPIYIKLFNLVFDSGIIHESWTCEVIKPIYKNKESPEDPSNYQPITLLSCIRKLFTAVINNRLKSFTEKHDLIGWVQSGFRKGYSTTENGFVLKCLMDMMQASKKGSTVDSSISNRHLIQFGGLGTGKKIQHGWQANVSTYL